MESAKSKSNRTFFGIIAKIKRTKHEKIMEEILIFAMKQDTVNKR